MMLSAGNKFAPIGHIATKKEFKTGKEFPLEDGSILKRFVPRFMAPGLFLMAKRRAFAAVGRRSCSRANMVAGYVFSIAGFSTLLGLVAEILPFDILRESGLGLETIIAGAVYAVLDYFVSRKSIIALSIAVILYFLEPCRSL